MSRRSCPDVLKAQVYVAGVPKTVHDTVRWLRDAIAPTLAVARQYWGNNYRATLTDLMNEGRERWKPRHVKLDAGVRLGALA